MKLGIVFVALGVLVLLFFCHQAFAYYDNNSRILPDARGELSNLNEKLGNPKSWEAGESRAKIKRRIGQVEHAIRISEDEMKQSMIIAGVSGVLALIFLGLGIVRIKGAKSAV